MLILEENLEKQCTVTYKLLREKVKDHLVGVQDERVRESFCVPELNLSGGKIPLNSW